MASDTRMVLHDPQPSTEWGRDEMGQAIKCIRKIHRHGQVLNLWDLAMLIHHENECMRPARKGATTFIIHKKLVDIFTRFESCRELSHGMDQSHHDRVMPRTNPYTMREVILRKLEWYYDLLAVLGKQLRFRSGFPVQSSSTRSEVRNDEPKLPIRPRETSTERVGGSIARRNSLGSYGYQDYKYDSRDGQRNGGQTRHRPFPNDVPTTTRKRSISRDELEEVNSKKPRKDSEVGTKTRFESFGTPRPHDAERHLSAPPKCKDVGAHEFIEDILAGTKLSTPQTSAPSSVEAGRNKSPNEDILAESQEKGELSMIPSAVPSSVDSGKNESPNEDALTDSYEQGGSVKQIPEAAEYSESRKAIGDKFKELGQLFHKQDTNRQSKIINGQTEILERLNQLEGEIAHRYSNLIIRQHELAETGNQVNAGTKQSHADLMKQSQGQHSELMQQFLRQEKHAQHNHAQTMKAREQHHKELLAKKETNEREERRRYEESIRLRDRAHNELMAKIDRHKADAQRQYEVIIRQQAEILTEIKAVQRSLVSSKKSAETSRADTTGGGKPDLIKEPK